MGTGRSYVATAVALGIITLSGCAADTGSDSQVGSGQEDWGDENKYPEIGGKFASLDALVGSCAFVNGTVTVTSTAAQTIIIGKRAVDSAILVNGATCSTVATATVPATAATSSLMKRLVVAGSTGADVVILDFLGGLLAPGVSSLTAGGIAIDLVSGVGDEVRIRGTSNVDAFYMGGDGLAFNADNFKDVTFANVDSVSIALAGGADTFTGVNALPTKGVTGNNTIPLTLFGGVGNDTIVGGAGIDNIYGGPGVDTLNGGPGADLLFGEEGADIFAQGLTADGNDTIDCGTDITATVLVDTSIDVVSYTQRTATVTATISSVDNTTIVGHGITPGEDDTILGNCEGLTGGSGNDLLKGNEVANVLAGGLGNDTLQGFAGDDTLNGEAGDDTFTEEGTTADNGSDVFNGGAGADTVDYGTRTVKVTATMDGTAGDDGIDGETDNIKADVENFIGGTAGDEVTGNPSANVFVGGLGDDILRGGAGNDTFNEGAVTSGADTFIGGAGDDLVDYHSRTSALTVTMGLDDTNVGDGEGSEGDDVQADIENLLGGSAIDTITGNDLNNDIKGGAALDVISGGEGDDTLDGEAGLAVIDCGGGTDVAFNVSGTRNINCEI